MTSIRINSETIVLVGVVIGIFLMALICLACSLNPRELLDGSLFRCCCRCCKNRRSASSSSNSQDPQVYATLNEFIFEANDDNDGEEGLRRPASTSNTGGYLMAMSNIPTSMEQVFPDLLSGDGTSSSSAVAAAAAAAAGTAASTTNSSRNGELSEPLL